MMSVPMLIRYSPTIAVSSGDSHWISSASWRTSQRVSGISVMQVKGLGPIGSSSLVHDEYCMVHATSESLHSLRELLRVLRPIWIGMLADRSARTSEMRTLPPCDLIRFALICRDKVDLFNLS